MIFKKIVVSIFDKNNNPTRLTINGPSLILILILFLLPYGGFVALMFDSYLSKHKVVSKQLPEIINHPKVVDQKPEALDVTLVSTNETEKVQEVKKEDKFRYSDLKIEKNGSQIDVSLILLKKEQDSMLSSGKILLEAIDTSGKILGISDKSIFRFRNARQSNFVIATDKVQDVSILRLVISEIGHTTYLNIPHN